MANIFSTFAQAHLEAQASALNQIHNSTRSVELTLQNMTLQEKIGQILLVGFRGLNVTDSLTIRRDIEVYKVGSVILFEYDAMLKSRPRNIQSSDQLKRLTQDLQKLSPKLPLFISVDEEGGLVNRLKPIYGFIKKPSAQELGDQANLHLTKHHAGLLVSELKAHGINLNFAPIVDVNVNPENPVIGKVRRSFSADPKQVALHAEAVVDAHNEGKVLSVLKHFPGHGSSTTDSHFGLVDVTQTWLQSELYPYQYLIGKNKVNFIMTAHVFQRSMDANYPATLSQKILTDVLRRQLNYKGVVISDDMDMAAIKDHFGFAEAIELALKAGVDILLFGNNLNYKEDTIKNAHEVIMRLIESGSLTESELDQKVIRVLLAKQKIGLIN